MNWGRHVIAIACINEAALPVSRASLSAAPVPRSGRYPLLGPDFHRLDRTSLRLAHLFDHLVCALLEG